MRVRLRELGCLGYVGLSIQRIVLELELCDRLLEDKDNDTYSIGKIKNIRIIHKKVNMLQNIHKTKIIVVGGGRRKRNNKKKKQKCKGERLNVSQKKWCRCVLDVASKNSERCNITQKFKIFKKCYNPYAVCTSVNLKQTKGKPCFHFWGKGKKIIAFKEVLAFVQLNYSKYNDWARSHGRLTYEEIQSLSSDREKKLRENVYLWYNEKKQKCNR